MKYALIILLLSLAATTAWAGDVPAADKENEAGLALHKKKKYAAALARFQKAAQLDPDKHIAQLNAACAASLDGQIDVAKRHAEAWLRGAPQGAAKLLYDPDLANLRADAAWFMQLRERLRPAGTQVRPLVFEWREKSGDLWMVGEDGLDRREVAADPAWREHDAQFSPDGKRLYYRATRNPDLNRHYLDPGKSYRRFGRDDDELRVMDFPNGRSVVLALHVQSYRVAADQILFVDVDGDKPRVRRQRTDQGKPETVATLEPASVAWCYATEGDGGLVVASGVPDKWGRGINLEVSRWNGGQRQVLMPRTAPRKGQRRLYDIQACALRDGVMELGGARLTITADAATIDVPVGMAYGQGAYDRRRRDSRGAVGAQATYVTVDGPVADVSQRRGPARWAASPLMWVQTNGMSDDWWYATRIVRWDRDGSTTTLTPDDVRFGDYGPAVSPDGSLAFTRLRGDEPWIVVSDPDGSSRLVAPGQYAVWGTAASIQKPGASLW